MVGVDPYAAGEHMRSRKKAQLSAGNILSLLLPNPFRRGEEVDGLSRITNLPGVIVPAAILFDKCMILIAPHGKFTEPAIALSPPGEVLVEEAFNSALALCKLEPWN